MTPYFVIVVHVAAVKNPESLGCTQGWVISRTLTDFAALHEKLIQVSDFPFKTIVFFHCCRISFAFVQDTIRN